MVGANTEAFTSFAFKYFQKFDWLKNLQMNTLMGVSFLLIKSVCASVRVLENTSQIFLLKVQDRTSK